MSERREALASELDPALNWVDASHTVKAAELGNRRLMRSLVTGREVWLVQSRLAEHTREAKPKPKLKKVKG